ncbi:MAG: DNA repair protein RadC [Herpetosiphonaceae bacterium]|nr:DNA repair protein RadC [Herpetosiphonaceae bacterium]
MANYFISVKDMPSSEQPRERLREHGSQALSDAELLAILLRVGVQGMNVIQLAQMLLRDHGGWRGLQQIAFADLCKIHGMGEAKAAHVKAAIEIGRRLLLAAPEERLQITSPADVAGLLQLEMSHLDKEHLRTVILNTKNHVLKIETVTIGSLNSAGVRIAEVFREPIKLNAAAIIVVHNHPSGDPTPSPDDILLTRQLIQAGQLLDIDVLDHLVIGQARWVSMRERKLGWG